MSSLGPNGTVRARRTNPNATTYVHSNRQRLSDAGDFVEQGGECDNVAASNANEESFESAAASIISDADPDVM